VREELLVALIGTLPLVEHRALDSADRLELGDARVRNAVEVPVEELLLLVRREVAVVRNPDVVLVRDEIEDVLLEVRARAADRVDLAAADHLG
jgi:hypothetical protein